MSKPDPEHAAEDINEMMQRGLFDTIRSDPWVQQAEQNWQRAWWLALSFGVAARIADRCLHSTNGLLYLALVSLGEFIWGVCWFEERTRRILITYRARRDHQ